MKSTLIIIIKEAAVKTEKNKMEAAITKGNTQSTCRLMERRRNKVVTTKTDKIENTEFNKLINNKRNESHKKEDDLRKSRNHQK